MYKFNVYWTDNMKISYLQRVILIHSFLYYKTDKAIWIDKKYDEISKQLVSLQNKKQNDWIKSNTQYGYVFYDFDGTTGFDLFERLNKADKSYISRLATNINRIQNK